MIIEIDKNSVDDIVNTYNNIILDIYTTWCGPCKMQSLELEKFSQSNQKWAIIKVDAEKRSDVAQQFAVQAVPTLVFIKNKQVKFIESGYKPASELKRLVESFNK